MARGKLYGIFADALHYFVLKRKEALEARGNSPLLRRIEKSLREHYTYQMINSGEISKDLDLELATIRESFK